MDMLVDKLIDRVTESPVQKADLDGTTLGKTHPDMAIGAPTLTQPLVPLPVSIAQDKLKRYGINPGPLETLALTAIDAQNRGTGMRNVAAMASRMPAETQARISQLAKDVVVRAQKIEDMPGVTPPLGFWDPQGFSTDIAEDKLIFLRKAELKHGRAAMIGALGLMSGELFSPIFDKGGFFTGQPLQSQLFLQATPAPYQAFWGAAFVCSAFAELAAENSEKYGDEGREIGDIGWDPLGMKPKEAAKLKEMQNKELNNGRLAMLAAAGMIAQEVLRGEKALR